MSDVDRVSIVVPTYGRPGKLRATLESVTAVDYEPGRVEVIVVDDTGGDNATADVVQSFQAGPIVPRLIRQANAGAAAARNRGAQAAEGDLLIFCDDDVIVAPDHVRQHLEAQRLYPGALVNGVSEFEPGVLAELEATPFGRYRIDLEHSFEAEADGPRLDESRTEAVGLTARNLAVRRALFRELEGFDEDFPYAGAEDQDLSIRARQAGRLLVRDHRIRVLNNEPTVTLRQFCVREERSAHTAAVLARKHPEQVGSRPIVVENRPISGSDGFRLILKKTLKAALSSAPMLAALHLIGDLAERAPISERARRRLYTGLVGLHMFKGVREAWSARGPISRDCASTFHQSGRRHRTAL